ncbi:MAG: hypothetical protein ACOX1S_05335 [Anaerostipes sp.]|jgi:hypothetical protein|nr:hypothetical protein [Anaerostipes sp.]
MSRFEIDVKEFERVTEAISKFSDGSEAEKVINDYLNGEGAERIKEKVMNLLPESGRTWSGKKAGAKSAQPFTQVQEENLSVTVKTKKAYQYLYFPDDGTNTKKHVGNQQFMFGGARDAEPPIINELIDRILKKLEEL